MTTFARLARFELDAYFLIMVLDRHLCCMMDGTLMGFGHSFDSSGLNAGVRRAGTRTGVTAFTAQTGIPFLVSPVT